ncbi:MAG: HD-GYP domain-containing protein [Marinisporobacter sp.]|jgi:HD-GYP domain-containing protein (c-di-GMP phosphodiesterase class II)|nr:HD-GYP domain-containing protein [Marinisporobacter sp.]
MEYVKKGDVLGKDIYNQEGRILLRRGFIMNNSMKKRLNDFGIYSLYIQDQYSDTELEEIIKPEIKQKAIQTIKNTFKTMHSLHKDDENHSFHEGFRKRLKEQQEQSLHSLNDISKMILEGILSQDTILVSMVDIKNKSEFLFQHAVNVSLLSLVLGKALNLNKKELEHLCLGALLHDIGKTLIPEEILWNKHKRTEGEEAIVKMHPTRGYDFLKGNMDIPSYVRIIILQHHEQINGKGYPRGMGEDIYKLSQIVSIANIYDNLTSDTPIRRAIPPHEALEYIMANAGTLFSFEMVEIFAKKIVPYPVGTLVRLSNGHVAVVKNIDPDFPSRPQIQIISNEPKEKIHLLNQPNLVIKGICYEI